MDLSLAGWSIHRRFQRDRDPLRLLDYPKVVSGEFGLAKAELNSPFFEYEDEDNPVAGAFKRDYLVELRKRADDNGVQLVGVAVDGHGDLAALDENERCAAVANHRKWFDACRVLGCGAFRANSGGKDGPTDPARIEQCVRSFGRLAEWGAEYGITVLMENHWGISNDPENIVQIVQAVGSKWFGTLPDFGNFTPEIDRYDALAKLAPSAVFVHAKFFDFDAQGEAVGIDVPRILNIFKTAGYQGTWGIEYEGEGDDHDGVLKSIVLMNKYAY